MVHRGEGYNRGMTSEIDPSGSLIELARVTLFDETRLAAYHPWGYKDLDKRYFSIFLIFTNRFFELLKE